MQQIQKSIIIIVCINIFYMFYCVVFELLSWVFGYIHLIRTGLQIRGPCNLYLGKKIQR